MVVIKRKRPDNSHMSSKKRKVDTEHVSKDGANGRQHKIRLDKLDWKPVDMAGRLDDYEGFFGLEEIEDVDVVRDETTGMVSFRSDGPLPKSTPAPITPKVDAEDPFHDEFHGFSDDEGATLEMSHTDSKTKKTKQKRDRSVKESNTINTKPGLLSGFDANMDLSKGQEDTNVLAWKKLHLSPDTLAGLSKLKFAKPTPIQKSVIPEIMAGHDVIGKASTGSGKTLAFGIPLFEIYLEERVQRAEAKKREQLAPLGVIITPTRELAHQINQHLMDLSNGLPNEKPSIATLTGGLSIQKQQRQLKYADIVIGTPGRLWEVISGSHDLIDRMKRTQILVLDEADRLLSQGHFKELEEILDALNRVETSDVQHDGVSEQNSTMEKHSRQTLVFSATFEKALQHKLAQRQKSHSQANDKKESMEYLIQSLRFNGKPKYIDVDPVRQMASGLKEGVVECAGTDKDLYLYAVQLLHLTSRTLVFVNSISSVRRIVPFLQNLGLPALPLHSQMIQKARLRSIERFSAKSSSSSILVATDVAARGLDIPNIDLIIHYHLPRTSDAYIHRSGRTARAGQTGSSILLCSPDEMAGVRRLVAQVHASSAATTATSKSEAIKQGHLIRSLDIDRRVVQRLRPRADLAKRIADVEAAKEKNRSRDDSFKQAAEDLGVEYDSEEFEKQATGRTGRGAGRRQKERVDREIGKDEVRSMRAELKGLLSQRVNVGVSERYPTGGNIDIDQLLMANGKSNDAEFLGHVRSLEMD